MHKMLKIIPFLIFSQTTLATRGNEPGLYRIMGSPRLETTIDIDELSDDDVRYPCNLTSVGRRNLCSTLTGIFIIGGIIVPIVWYMKNHEENQ